MSKPNNEMIRNITPMLRNVLIEGLPCPFFFGRILTLKKGKRLQVQIVPMHSGQRLWQSPTKIKSISIKED